MNIAKAADNREIFDIKNAVTVKTGLRALEGH